MFNKRTRDEVVYIANGMLEAESVRIMLESFEIPAFVNQESAGTVYGLSVGPLGEVEVVVPTQFITAARQVIDDMRAGKLELPDSE